MENLSIRSKRVDPDRPLSAFRYPLVAEGISVSQKERSRVCANVIKEGVLSSCRDDMCALRTYPWLILYPSLPPLSHEPDLSNGRRKGRLRKTN